MALVLQAYSLGLCQRTSERASERTIERTNERTHNGMNARTNKRRTNSRARDRPPAARTHEQTTIDIEQTNKRSDFERTGGPERAGAAVGSVSIAGGVPSVWLLGFRQYGCWASVSIAVGLPSV